jgi:Ser/Thr protein kinase RdoA (MazF antagonist)
MNLPSSVLAELWGIPGALERSSSGVSRATWRAAEGYWLTCCEVRRESAFRRECALLANLGETLAAHHELALAVPTLVPTVTGEVVPAREGFLWRLSRHLAGSHPVMNDPASYELMVHVLVRVHQALDLVRDRCPGCPDVLGRVRARLNALGQLSLTAEEGEVLPAAADWLRPRIGRLDAFPTRLVHGDWTPSNVLVGPTGAAGILDFEECGLGPSIYDFANICSTLLMWSGLDNVGKRMAWLVGVIEENLGAALDEEMVQTAMLAHWFGQYFDWRERTSTSENSQVLDRLRGRVQTVLRWRWTQD